MGKLKGLVPVQQVPTHLQRRHRPAAAQEQVLGWEKVDRQASAGGQRYFSLITFIQPNASFLKRRTGSLRSTINLNLRATWIRKKKCSTALYESIYLYISSIYYRTRLVPVSRVHVSPFSTSFLGMAQSVLKTLFGVKTLCTSTEKNASYSVYLGRLVVAEQKRHVARQEVLVFHVGYSLKAHHHPRVT